MLHPACLNPTNTTWLFNFDTTQSYVGWAFFRNSEWTNPVGLNPLFGLDIASSIVYSNSTPLLAIFFKLFHAWLPQTFQYAGLWILLCFILQAYFAWKLSRLTGTNTLNRILITAILTFSPPMIWRIGLVESLMAHFLILWALYLDLKPKHTRAHNIASWVALLSIAVLVNFYLFVMCGALWLASFIHRNWHTHFRLGWYEAPITILIVLFCAWQAGYFQMHVVDAKAEGFEYGGLNLLSFLNPEGWSYLIPNIPHPVSDYDRFNYLGIGNLLLLFFAVVIAFLKPPEVLNRLKHRWPLVLIMLLVGLVAISNIVYLGKWSLSYDMPALLLDLAGLVRTSNRLSWVLWYLLIIVALILLMRRLPSKMSTALLTIVLTLQIADTSAGWLPKRKELGRMNHMPSSEKSLSHPFWQSAAKVYKNIEQYPVLPDQYQPRWKLFAPFAAQHQMATNMVYFSRPVDELIASKNNQQFRMQKMSGVYKPDTLYIFDQWKYNPFINKLRFDRTKDLLANIDGNIVFAPNWKQCAQCIQVDPKNELDSLRPGPICKNGDKAKYAHDSYVISGFDYPNNLGSWSNGKSARLIIPTSSIQKGTIELIVTPFINQQKIFQTVAVEINGKPNKVFLLTSPQKQSLEIPVEAPQNTDHDHYIVLDLKFDSAIAPKKIGLNDDVRELAILLHEIKIN